MLHRIFIEDELFCLTKIRSFYSSDTGDLVASSDFGRIFEKQNVVDTFLPYSTHPVSIL